MINDKPQMNEGFIIPVEGDHLGLPIIWDSENDEYYQFNKAGITQLSEVSKASDPSDGYAIKGEFVAYRGDEFKRYSLTSASIMSLNKTLSFKPRNRANNAKLDEYISSLSSNFCFDIDSPVLIDILDKAMEFEADIFIHWFDRESGFGFSICEG